MENIEYVDYLQLAKKMGVSNATLKNAAHRSYGQVFNLDVYQISKGKT